MVSQVIQGENGNGHPRGDDDRLLRQRIAANVEWQLEEDPRGRPPPTARPQDSAESTASLHATVDVRVVKRNVGVERRDAEAPGRPGQPVSVPLEGDGTASPEHGHATLRDFESVNPAMRRFLQHVWRVVDKDDVSLLLLGETGVGKGRLAEAIHRESPRSAGPFVVFSCTEITGEMVTSRLLGHEKGAFTGAYRTQPGVFEAAQGGTLFVDEIGDLPKEAQAKLLNILGDRVVTRIDGKKPIPLDVRVLSATNQDLLAAVREGRFRQDLYHRSAGFPLTIPPLRDRPEDVRRFIFLFFDQFQREYQTALARIEDDAVEMLLAYPWPGNVRELMNVLRRLVLTSPGPDVGVQEVLDVLPTGSGGPTARRAPAPATVRREGIPAPEAVAHARPKPLEETLDQARRQAIQSALEWAGGNVSEAARALAVNRRTLGNRIRAYGIDRCGPEDSTA